MNAILLFTAKSRATIELDIFIICLAHMLVIIVQHRQPQNTTVKTNNDLYEI